MALRPVKKTRPLKHGDDRTVSQRYHVRVDEASDLSRPDAVGTAGAAQTGSTEGVSSISEAFARHGGTPAGPDGRHMDDLLKEGFTEQELREDPGIIARRAAQQDLVRSIPGIVELAEPGSQADQYELGPDGRPATVYYASYGSNLFADRFAAYVEGGQPDGSNRVYDGCRDTTPPSDDIPVALNGTIHYAGESLVWTGGVAFLDPTTSGKSLGRAYRLTGEQFDDVVAQECNEKPGSKTVDTTGLIANGRHVEPGNYGALVHVGDYNGSPVFTFTGPFTTAQARSASLVINPDGHLVDRGSPAAAEQDGKKKPWPVFTNQPSEAYRAMIGSGLAETHKLTPEQVGVYFAGSTGVAS